MRLVFGSFASGAFLLSGCLGGSGLVNLPDDTVTETIGARGGTLETADGNFRLVFPEGALDRETQFTIQSDFNVPPGRIGRAYSVRPQLVLMAEAAAIYNYSSTDIGRPEEQLTVGAVRDGAWITLERTALRTDVKEVEAAEISIAPSYGLLDRGHVADTDTVADDDDTIGDATTEASDVDDTISDTTSDADGTTEVGEASSTTDDGTTDAPTIDPLCGDGHVVVGEVCYLEGVSFTSPANPSGVVTGDFDGNGALDVAVIGGGNVGVVQVRFGTGTGVLAAPANYPVGDTPSALVLANVNGDAHDDLVVVNTADGNVGLLLGQAGGTFGAHTTFDIGQTLPIALATADFNGDGFLDVVTANEGSENVTWMSGNGAGIFSADGSTALPAPPRSIGVGDFTGDTNFDFVTAAGSALVLNAGNGAGLFGGPSSTEIGGTTTGLFVADLNDDGNLDVAITSDTGHVTVALGNGTTGFGGGVPYVVGENPTAVIAVDVDLDGDLDLVIANTDDDTITILLGNGMGGFSSPETFLVGAGPRALATGDFNSDGVPDLLVANGDESTVSVLLSNP